MEIRSQSQLLPLIQEWIYYHYCATGEEIALSDAGHEIGDFFWDVVGEQQLILKGGIAPWNLPYPGSRFSEEDTIADFLAFLAREKGLSLQRAYPPVEQDEWMS